MLIKKNLKAMHNYNNCKNRENIFKSTKFVSQITPFSQKDKRQLNSIEYYNKP